MQLSVIILNYNVRYFLEQCVSSVQKAIQNLDAEIIVVDNNSSDDSCAMMKSVFPNVKLIENKENSGFPKGNNIGVASAKGQYLCILNPDTVVAEDTFEKTLAFAEKQNNLGIIGVKLINGKGNFLPESKRGIPTPFVAFTKVSGLYEIFPKSALLGKYYAQHLNKDQTGEAEIFVGAFMIMTRETYLEVGGFDENCFMYSDDIDLSYMVLKTGKSNYYFAETTVIHYKGESTIRDGTYMKRFQEAMDFFYRKHFRASFFFDVFMKIGAYFFTLAKKNKVVEKIHPDQYIVISNTTLAKEKAEKLLGKNVHLTQSIAEINLNSFSGITEIVFDAASLSYNTIIGLMQKWNNAKITFKILHIENGFIIGSNSSNDRGEVLK